MEIISLPCGGGKTERLLRCLSLHPEGCLFVFDTREQKRLLSIIKKSYKDVIDSKQIKVFGRESMAGTIYKFALIDNADICLEKAVNGSVRMISITENE